MSSPNTLLNNTFHDWLALGEFEKALEVAASEKPDPATSTTTTEDCLPYFLRLLEERYRNHDRYPAIQCMENASVIPRMEEAAVLFSTAEHIQVEASYVVPHVLQRHRQSQKKKHTTTTPSEEVTFTTQVEQHVYQTFKDMQRIQAATSTATNMDLSLLSPSTVVSLLHHDGSFPRQRWLTQIILLSSFHPPESDIHSRSSLADNHPHDHHPALRLIHTLALNAPSMIPSTILRALLPRPLPSSLPLTQWSNTYARRMWRWMMEPQTTTRTSLANVWSLLSLEQPQDKTAILLLASKILTSASFFPGSPPEHRSSTPCLLLRQIIVFHQESYLTSTCLLSSVEQRTLESALIVLLLHSPLNNNNTIDTLLPERIESSLLWEHLPIFATILWMKLQDHSTIRMPQSLASFQQQQYSSTSFPNPDSYFYWWTGSFLPSRRLLEPAHAGVQHFVTLERFQQAFSTLQPQKSLDTMDHDSSVPQFLLFTHFDGLSKDCDKARTLLQSNTLFLLLKEIVQQRQGLPFVLPLDIEKEVSKVKNWFVEDWTTNLSDHRNSVLLRFIYALVFRESHPSSPFAIDPLLFPVDLILQYCQSLCVSGVVSEEILDHFESLCEPFCYTLPYCTHREYIHRGRTTDTLLSEDPSPSYYLELFQTSIRKIMAASDKKERDPSPLPFATVLQHCSAKDVCLAFLTTLLSSPIHQPLIFSFRRLCTDPLLFLKVPVRSLQDSRVRRIYFVLLESVLQFSDRLLLEECPNQLLAREWQASRNLIVFRSVLSQYTQSPERVACRTTVLFIRQLIANDDGILAAFLRQNPPKETIEWLIHHVPEILDESLWLERVVEQTASVVVTERILIANMMVQIAITYGQRDLSVSDGLIVAALKQLPAVVPIIAGPPGISVATVLSSSHGTTTTTSSQVCYDSAIEILKNLRKIKWWRKAAKNSVAMYLSKFVSIVRNDASVGKSKKRLKELHDTSLMTLNLLGMSLQL